MHQSAPSEEGQHQGSSEQCGPALAEAVAGLEAIRDEGPDTEPVYPTHGGIEAHEVWAFDSASHERAQTARDTLATVAEIVEGRPASSL